MAFLKQGHTSVGKYRSIRAEVLLSDLAGVNLGDRWANVHKRSGDAQRNWLKRMGEAADDH